MAPAKGHGEEGAPTPHASHEEGILDQREPWAGPFSPRPRVSQLLCPAEDGAHPRLQEPGAVQAETQFFRQGPALSSYRHLTMEEAGAVGQRFQSEQGLGWEEKGITNPPKKYFLRTEINPCIPPPCTF